MPLLTEPGLSGRGKREDLADMIALVDARDTPFVSMARKGSKPGNMLFQWQADKNPVQQVGGTIDGSDISGYSNYVTDARRQLSNYAQIYRRVVRVSKLAQDLADVAGVRDALSDNVAKAIVGIKRDMEFTMTSNQLGQADTGSIPYLTAGVQSWIGGDVIGTGLQALGPSPTAPSFRTPAESIAGGRGGTLFPTDGSWSDATVQDVMKSIFSQTGQYKSFDCICGVELKRAFTSLLGTTSLTTTVQSPNLGVAATKVQTFQRDAGADTFIQSLDVFQGDFGTIRLHPTTFLGTISYVAGPPQVGSYANTPYQGLVLDMSLIEVRYGGNVAQVTALPDNGGGPARLIEAVAGLVVGNPLGLGRFNYTNSVAP